MNSFALESKTQHTIVAVSALAFISLLAGGKVAGRDGEGWRSRVAVILDSEKSGS